jgi:hypothetical protein
MANDLIPPKILTQMKRWIEDEVTKSHFTPSEEALQNIIDKSRSSRKWEKTNWLYILTDRVKECFVLSSGEDLAFIERNQAEQCDFESWGAYFSETDKTAFADHDTHPARIIMPVVVHDDNLPKMLAELLGER